VDTSGNWRSGLVRDSIGHPMVGRAVMGVQIGFWDIEHRLAELSVEGDPLETLSNTKLH